MGGEALVVGGSDWDVRTMDVLDAVEVTVTRHPSDALDQAVGVAAMLRAYTADGARALGRDDVGRLAPGMRADLVLLDADPLAVAPEALSGVRVRGTWIDGVRVGP